MICWLYFGLGSEESIANYATWRVTEVVVILDDSEGAVATVRELTYITVMITSIFEATKKRKRTVNGTRRYLGSKTFELGFKSDSN